MMHSMSQTMTRVVLMGVLMVSLSACVSSSQTEIQQWMEQERQRAKPHIQPVAAPRQFVPETFDVQDRLDPFNGKKLSVALLHDARDPKVNPLLAQEYNRPKEPLESYPLDALSMVGVITKDKEMIALIKVDNQLLPIKVGNYLGQNHGKVTKITGSSVVTRELAQNAVGEWTYRSAELTLQERSK